MPRAKAPGPAVESKVTLPDVVLAIEPDAPKATAVAVMTVSWLVTPIAPFALSVAGA